jgi:D-3-phosphoglycerate dehydrogenase
MTKILVSDSLSKEGLKILENDGNFQVDYLPDITPEELVERIVDYDALVVRSRTRATAEVLRAGKNLKVVGRAGVGLDNVDLAVATERGIIVMNTPGGNTISAAEHTMSLIMGLARQIPEADRSMKEGKWEKKKLNGTELRHKVLGIVGLGRIGREVAKRAQAFEMRVIGYDPYVSPEVIARLGVESASLEDLMKASDVITVHTPVTDETRSLIGAEEIKKMKPEVWLINCARGGIIDEMALAEALKAGRIGGAALDVFEKEPLPADHPLRSCPNIILTPHLGASTKEAQHSVALEIAEQIVDALTGKMIRNAANAPSIDPEIWALMRPYLSLAEKMGKFESQLCTSRVKRLTAQFSGGLLDFPLSALTTAVVKGFLEPTADDTVNYVNAMPKAKSIGMEVVESKTSSPYQYTNLITVIAEMENGETNTVSGTLFAPDMPRLVIINDKRFDAYPEGNMIVIENRDVPGIVGSVGTLLGKHKINIAQMTWGRTDHNQEAMTVINVDEPVSPQILEEISRLPNIKSARLIRI